MRIKKQSLIVGLAVVAMTMLFTVFNSNESHAGGYYYGNQVCKNVVWRVWKNQYGQVVRKDRRRVCKSRPRRHSYYAGPPGIQIVPGHRGYIRHHGYVRRYHRDDYFKREIKRTIVHGMRAIISQF